MEGFKEDAKPMFVARLSGVTAESGKNILDPEVGFTIMKSLCMLDLYSSMVADVDVESKHSEEPCKCARVLHCILAINRFGASGERGKVSC